MLLVLSSAAEALCPETDSGGMKVKREPSAKRRRRRSVSYAKNFALSLRWLILITLVCCFTAYFANSLAKYQEGRVGMAVSEETQSIFHFPTVAVCAKVPELKDHTEFEPWINMVIMETQYSDDGGKTFAEKQFVTFPYKGTSSSYAEALDSQDMWRDFIIMVKDKGQYLCNSFKPPETAWSQYGVTNMFLINVKTTAFQGSPYYFVGVEHEEVFNPVTLLENIVFVPVTKEASNLNNSRFYAMTDMKLGELTSLGRDEERPCLPEEEDKDDILKCTLDYISSFVPCYGHDILAHKSGENITVPSKCSPEDMKKVEALYFQLYEGGKAKFLDIVGCKLPCLRSTYEVNLQSIIEGAPLGPEGSMMLALYASESTKTVKTEFLIYDLAGLAGDVGGMVGMLLGASFLALYDVVLDWVNKLVRVCNKT